MGASIFSKPYIVLMGAVGSGKSTIVEKLTGVKGRSGADKFSVTTSSEVFQNFDGSLDICDTPGTNAREDRFMHNMQTCTDSHFFRFTTHHDSYDSNWIQLFIDSFITEIL